MGIGAADALRGDRSKILRGGRGGSVALLALEKYYTRITMPAPSDC